MKSKGFTLIEIIIVIAVFSIGIMAVFYLVTNNLERLDETKTRNLATFLAKEGIELTFNIRDANLIKELERDCVFTEKYINSIPPNFCDGYFASGLQGKYIQISFNPNEYSKLIWTGLNTFENNRLYYHSGNIEGNNIFWYDHNSNNGEKTIFSRYIVFTGVKENGNILPTDKILKIESHVLFSKGSKTGEVILESFIGNY
ncbi:MAG: prepilin-type N-terminal cleavage/methylation domain-containing protein [Candidatus Absconditicoccaceae bacterium]